MLFSATRQPNNSTKEIHLNMYPSVSIVVAINRGMRYRHPPRMAWKRCSPSVRPNSAAKSAAAGTFA